MRLAYGAIVKATIPSPHVILDTLSTEAIIARAKGFLAPRLAAAVVGGTAMLKALGITVEVSESILEAKETTDEPHRTVQHKGYTIHREERSTLNLFVVGQCPFPSGSICASTDSAFTADANTGGLPRAAAIPAANALRAVRPKSLTMAAVRQRPFSSTTSANHASPHPMPPASISPLPCSLPSRSANAATSFRAAASDRSRRGAVPSANAASCTIAFRYASLRSIGKNGSAAAIIACSDSGHGLFRQWAKSFGSVRAITCWIRLMYCGLFPSQRREVFCPWRPRVFDVVQPCRIHEPSGEVRRRQPFAGRVLR